MTKVNKVYIQTMEAKTIYNQMKREIVNENKNYSGLIPNSLELKKLLDNGLEITKSKSKDKFYSNDIINVKFNQTVEPIKDVIKEVEKRIESTEKKIENTIQLIDSEGNDKRIERLQKRLEESRQQLELYKSNLNYLMNECPHKNGLNLNQLRKELYENGFKLVDDETGEIIKYVHYKRSSAKSRTGECWFIHTELHDSMIKWSRLNLPFKEGQNVDLPSLLAYESLVTSSIEATVKINPKHILLINDVESGFYKDLKKVIKGEDGNLHVVNEPNMKITNTIWDGQSLVDESVFESVGLSHKGMMLLRQGMFKSAAFNTKITEYLKHVAKQREVKFDTWKLKDMFGNKILAKNIKMITTPSSLKVLKFADLMEGETKQDKQNAIYQHWIDFVKFEEKSIFGICKNEKKSKFGANENDETINRFSYQMLNSLAINESKLKELMEFELQYISNLKNNTYDYITYLNQSDDHANTNKLYIALYELNKEFERTDLFREFKKTKINSYIDKVKSGKVKVENADYSVLFGNPFEMLYASHGKLMKDEVGTVQTLTLKGNEVYSPLFKDGVDLTGFRSPHSSPSNVLVVKNKNNDEFEWFNLTSNIVCINSTDNEILDTLSGSDFDSDTMLLVENEILHNVALECQKYKVVRNEIPSDKTTYKLTNEDVYKVDKKLAKSKTVIGEVTNNAQLALSIMWDAKSKGNSDVEKEMMEIVDICTVLSGIAIDEAKKQSGIVLSEEIKKIQKQIKKQLIDDKKPLFFNFVSKNENLQVSKYNTPMDYLQGICEKEIIHAGRGEGTIKFTDLMKKHKLGTGNYQQEIEMLDKVEKIINRIDAINIKRKKAKNNDSLRQELHNELEKAYADLHKAIPNKMTFETMYDTVMHQFISNKNSKNKKVSKKSYLLNALFEKHPSLFLSIFE